MRDCCVVAGLKFFLENTSMSEIAEFNLRYIRCDKCVGVPLAADGGGGGDGVHRFGRNL